MAKTRKKRLAKSSKVVQIDADEFAEFVMYRLAIQSHINTVMGMCLNGSLVVLDKKQRKEVQRELDAIDRLKKYAKLPIPLPT